MAGGVSDYTRAVAEGLAAAGDSVTVFAPPGAESREENGVMIRSLPDHFGPRSLRALDRALSRGPRPDFILIQYVPHAFGWKAMNLPFAVWVSLRARRHGPVWVMFHEVLFPFAWRPSSHAVLGVVSRLMARLIAGAADRTFVSIPAWGSLLSQILPSMKPPTWLPVPCVVASDATPEAVATVRRSFPSDAVVIGHFGTFGSYITAVLGPTISLLLSRRPSAHVLLIGRNAERLFVALATEDTLSERVHVAGELPADEIGAYLLACDVLLLPYPDGISSRRGTAMAGLAHGVPIVSNAGALSEALWSTSQAVRLAAGFDATSMADAVEALLDDPERERTGERGKALYAASFDVERIIHMLRS